MNATNAQLTQYGCGTWLEQRFYIRGSHLQNNFTLRSALHGESWCWDVPYSSTADHVGLTEYYCYDTLNQRWILG